MHRMRVDFLQECPQANRLAAMQGHCRDKTDPKRAEPGTMFARAGRHPWWRKCGVSDTHGMRCRGHYRLDAEIRLDQIPNDGDDDLNDESCHFMDYPL